jgi:O-antigen/teichoic acid export membrane protein
VSDRATPVDLRAVPPDQPAGASAAHDKAIVSGVMWQGAMRWLSQVLAWSATIVVARRLSPEDYGISGTATVLLGLLMLVVDGGLGRALMLRRDKDPAVVAQAHGGAELVGLGAALLMLLAAWPLSRFYNEPRVAPVMVLLSLALQINGTNVVPMAVLQQRLEYRRVALIEFVRAIAQAGTVLVCAMLGLRYWSLAIGLVAGSIAARITTSRYITIGRQRPTREILGPTAHYARQMVIGVLAWYAYANSDFVVLGRVVGMSALGYYQFAWNIAQLPGEKLGNVLQAVILPFFGSIGDNKEALRHYYCLLSELMVGVMLPVLVGFVLVSPIAVPLIFGAKWEASVPLVQILLLSTSIATLALLSFHVLGATGQAMVGTRLNLGAVVVLPICFFLAAKLSGPRAVALVWLVAQPVLVGIPLVAMKSTIGLSIVEYFKALRAPVASCALMACAVFGVQVALGGAAPIVRLVAMCVAGAVVYAGAFRVLFPARVAAIVALWRSRK